MPTMTDTHPQGRERYVARREMAAILDVSLSTLDRRVRAGMPSHPWSARARKFLPSEAIAWSDANGPHAATASVVDLDERRRRVQ